MIQNMPGIDAVADVSQLRTVLYQSGTLVHGPYGMGMQPVDADLTAIAALSGTGIATRTGSGTWATRTITGTANEITVTNGNGVGGNPTLSLAGFYEVGTWTPFLFGATTAGTYTYSTQSGVFTRIGRLVYARFHVQVSGVSSAGSGTLNIGGLPYNTLAGINQGSGSLGVVSGIAAVPANFAGWGLRNGPTGAITIQSENSAAGSSSGADIATVVGSTTQFRGAYIYEASL